MFTIGLYPNMDKPGMANVVCQTVDYLQQQGVCVVLPKIAAAACGLPELAASHEAMRKTISLAVTLGGDGTILHIARELAESGLPVCGVNMGNLGFLTAAEHNELRPALDRLLAGDYLIEERMMLRAVVRRNDEVLFSAKALNDVVLTNGGSHRLTRLNVYVDDALIAGYPADGLILATPTGATGYSLSAGGPVVSPHVEAIVITPICPHTLYSRSLVISRRETVNVIPQPGQDSVALTIDGQLRFSLSTSDVLNVAEAPEKARLIRFHDKSYYFTLRNKLRRGEIDAAN